MFGLYRLTITIRPIKEMQECDFENLYFVFYVEKIVAGQVSLILSSKGLNHNLKISPPAPGIFLLDSTSWFLYLKKNPDGKSRNAIQRQWVIIIIHKCPTALKPLELRT